MSPRDYRDKAGLTLEVAARRVHISPAYLARIERHGSGSFLTCERLAKLYGCSLKVFIRGGQISTQRT